MSDSVGSVSVEVVPDARGWSEKLRSQLRDQKVTVNADADTTEAETQLDEVARTRTAKIKTDTSELSKGTNEVGKFVDKLGIIPALAIAAGAALIPLAATFGGIAAALGAPLIIGGGAFTLFAFLGGFAIKNTETQLKNIDSLQKKLDGLTKGTKDYADTQKQLRDAQAALTPAQKEFASSLDGLQGAFASLLAGKSGQALLGTIAGGMDLLSKSLPVVAPLITDVSRAIDPLLSQLGDAAQSRGFAQFVDQAGRLGGRDIVAGAHIIGNLAQGVGGLLLQFDKHLSGGLLDDLDHLSGSFASFGTDAHSKGLHEFFDYFHRVGPQVGSTIGAVARAIGHIAAALAPLGPVVLSGLTHAANALSSIPVPVLTALAAATVGLTAFNKLGGFKATSFAINKLTSGSGIAGGLIGATKVVPVFVTNKGFGGEGEGGWLSKILKKGGPTAAGAEGTAALTAPEIAAMAGLFTAGVAGQTVLTQSERHGFANYGKHTVTPPGMYGNNTGYVDKPGQQHFQFNPANHVAWQPTRDATAFDALRAHAAAASQTIDRIGPNATASLAGAIRTVGVLQGHIDNLHDKKLTIIANTGAAVASLERLQAMRIADKHFTVYQRFQALERTVGPGGGMGQNPHGSGGGGSSGGGAGGGGGRSHVTLHVGDRQFDAYMDQRADNVYHANRGYEDQAAGR